MSLLQEKCDTCDSKKCKSPVLRARARTCIFLVDICPAKSVLSDAALSVQAKQFISNWEERNTMTNTCCWGLITPKFSGRTNAGNSVFCTESEKQKVKTQRKARGMYKKIVSLQEHNNDES